MIEKVDISFLSWLRLLLVLTSAFVLWQVRAIVSLLFIVFILVQALRPVVRRLVAVGLTRGVSILVTYLALVSLFVLALSLVIPPLIDQLSLLAATIPSLIARIRPLYEAVPDSVNLQQFLTSLTTALGRLTGDVLTVASHLFGSFVSLLTVLALSAYLLADEHQLDAMIHLVVPSRLTGQVRTLLEKIGGKMGGWVRGQVTLSVTVGTLTFVALSILGVPYALTLAVVAGILEILPVVGPILTAVLGVILVLGTGSWALTLATLAAFAFIQQVENHFIVPRVIQRAVGLSPAVTIVALLIGSSLGGIAGAVLAVPIAAGIDVLVDEWPRLRDAFDRR